MGAAARVAVDVAVAEATEAVPARLDPVRLASRNLSAAGLAGRSALAQPSIGGAAKKIIYVPQANLTSLDPVWTTAVVTRNHAGLVFETLFGRDEKLNAQPQMVESFENTDAGKTWIQIYADMGVNAGHSSVYVDLEAYA